MSKKPRSSSRRQTTPGLSITIDYCSFDEHGRQMYWLQQGADLMLLTEVQALKVAECFQRFATSQSCDKASKTISSAGEFLK